MDIIFLIGFLFIGFLFVQNFKKSLNKFIYKNKFKIVKRIDTPISMKQIDYPYNNIFTKYFLYTALYIILKIEKIFNMSWLQTVIFKKIK